MYKSYNKSAFSEISPDFFLLTILHKVASNQPFTSTYKRYKKSVFGTGNLSRLVHQVTTNQPSEKIFPDLFHQHPKVTLNQPFTPDVFSSTFSWPLIKAFAAKVKNAE